MKKLKGTALLLAASLLVMTLSGCTENPKLTESQTEDTEETQTETEALTSETETPTESESETETYYQTDTLFYTDVKDSEVVFTDKVMENLSAFFVPAMPIGTLKNQGNSAGNLTAVIDSSITYQTIEGFGGSGCWWACFSDYYDEEALDTALILLYSQEYGIGLTTYRHNVGGGTPSSAYGKVVTECVEECPGFMNLERDAQGMKVIRKLQSLGVDYFTLFMNSPPARLCANNDTRGAEDGSSNLPEENYEEYAKYCADVIELYTLAGVPVKYLSPINEPQWKWSPAKWQEGCHYEYNEVFNFDKILIQEVERRGLTTKISVPESAAWYDETYTIFLINKMFYNNVYKNHVDHISVHDYGAQAKHKENCMEKFKKSGMNWPVHMTEWTNLTTDYDTMPYMTITRDLNEDFSILNCTLFEWWTIMNMTDDSLKDTTNAFAFASDDGRAGLGYRAYVVGQYSKFITGATRIEMELTDENDEVYGTAYVKDGQTIVILNNESTSERTVSLSGITGIGAMYTTDGELRLQYNGDVDAAYGITLSPESVNTIVFE